MEGARRARRKGISGEKKWSTKKEGALNDARLARCYFFSIGPRGSRGTRAVGRGTPGRGRVGRRRGRGVVSIGSGRRSGGRARVEGAGVRADAPICLRSEAQDAGTLFGSSLNWSSRDSRYAALVPETNSSCIRAFGVGAVLGGPLAAAAYGLAWNARSAEGATQRRSAPAPPPWWSGAATAANPRERGPTLGPGEHEPRGSAEGRERRSAPPITRAAAWRLMARRGVVCGAGAGEGRPPFSNQPKPRRRFAQTGPPCEQPGGKISPRRERVSSLHFLPGSLPVVRFFRFFHSPFSQKPSRVPPPPFVLPSSVPSPFLRRPRSPPHPPITRRRSSS